MRPGIDKSPSRTRDNRVNPARIRLMGFPLLPPVCLVQTRCRVRADGGRRGLEWRVRFHVFSPFFFPAAGLKRNATWSPRVTRSHKRVKRNCARARFFLNFRPFHFPIAVETPTESGIASETHSVNIDRLEDIRVSRGLRSFVSTCSEPHSVVSVSWLPSVTRSIRFEQLLNRKISHVPPVERRG